MSAQEESSWETDKIVESMSNGRGPYVSGDTPQDLRDNVTDAILEGVPDNGLAHLFLMESLRSVDWTEVFRCVIGDEPEEDPDGEDDEWDWDDDEPESEFDDDDPPDTDDYDTTSPSYRFPDGPMPRSEE